MIKSTRLSMSHSIFEAPLAKLPSTQLPLQSEVARHFLFLKTNKHKSNEEIIPVLGQLHIEVWNRASIPPQSLKNVNSKLSWLMERGSEQRWKPVGSTGRSGCRSGRDSSTGRSSRLKNRSNSPFWLLKDI